MRFRILGPLQVEDAGAPVAVGGPRPRRLLAALLLAAGEVVPADRLVDAVWGGAPPPGALTALRAYVSRLRGVLGPGVRLDHRPPGYRLTLDGAGLDAAEFEQRVAAARAATAAGDHARALAELDAGLALWTGDALVEFADEEFAAPAATRLTELRRSAAEDRADALLELGRAAEVVPELEELVRRHPARERPAVSLMRALYAAGRQADALDAYQDLRRRLDDELGVAPAAPAQALHRRILAHDPALLPRAPGNLPRRLTSFVGRDEEVAAVLSALRASPLVTLTGVGGAGKSRLAVEVARCDRARFPDGVWLCELAALPDGGPVGHAVAAVLRVRQRAGLTIEATVVEYLRPRSLLLVVDNCEHVRDPAARLVAEVVEHCPGVVVLTTSREGLGVPGEQLWPVPPLPAQPATALFADRARAVSPGFRLDAATAGAVATVCARLDGLPLAIELAAARTRMMHPAEVARRLEDAPLVGGGRGPVARHQSLHAAIDWSFRLLSEPEQRMFCHMSVFAGGADLRAVHRVAVPHLSEDDALDLLARLVDRSLVVVDGGSAHSRYRLLETLRAYGRRQVELTGGSDALARRHAAYYTELAEAAARGVQSADERAWVDQALPDHHNMRTAFLRAYADGDGALALRMVAAMPELVDLRIGYEALGWAEQTLPIADPDHPCYVAAVGAAARGAWNRGEFAHARALAHLAAGRTPAPGAPRFAHPRDVLADVALYEGDVDAALRHYAAEAERARGGTDPVRLVWTLFYVALCHAVRRRPELGIPAAQEGLALAETTANPTALSMARYALGLVVKKSEPARALRLFDEAAELAASVRNFWWEGIALMEAAATRTVHGDPAEAARAFVRVLDLWDRVGDRRQQWLNLRYVTRLLARAGAADEATALDGFLVAAGRPSPLHRPPPAPATGGDGADPAQAAVALARRALARCCTPGAAALQAGCNAPGPSS